MISLSRGPQTRRFAAAVLLCFAVSVSAFSVSGDEQSPTGVSGRVIDAKTKNPVQRYEIIVLQMQDRTSPRSEITEISRNRIDDRNGEFRVFAPAGSFVRILADQFLPVEVPVAPGQAPLEIALQPGIRFHGIVASVQRSPLSGVEVTYRVSSMLQGASFERKTRTDAKGLYEIALAPGDSVIVFDQPGFVREEISFTASEKQPSRDVTLHSAIFARGRVLDDLGQPLAGARVRASWLTRTGILKDVVTDDQGRFSLTDLRKGPYKVEVSKANYVPSLRASVDLPATEDLAIRLDRGAMVTGTVSGISEEEKPYVFVYLNETMTATNLVGKYGIRGVPPGPTVVVAEFASQGKLKRSSSKRVELVNGGTAEVNLDFRGEKGVRGRVFEGETPATRVVVELTPEGFPGRPARVAVAEDGSFEVLGLEPGRYQLAVPGHQILSEKRMTIKPGTDMSIKVQREPVSDRQEPLRSLATKPSS